MRAADVVSSATGYLLLKLATAAEARLEQTLRPFRLRGRTLRVLAFVDGGAVSQRDLCRQTGLDRTTMVGVIDELEQNGYVRRDRSPSDRRKQVITITEDGRHVLGEALAALRRTEEEFLAPLPPDDRGRLHHLLSALFAAHDPRCQTDEPGEDDEPVGGRRDIDRRQDSRW